MAVAKDQKEKEIDLKWYRFMYAAFVLLSIYYFFISKDIEAAAATLGVALIADPFDHRIVWNKRPTWQRAWLIIHLILLFAAFTYMIIK